LHRRSSTYILLRVVFLRPSQFCSGGWDNAINVWDLTNADTVVSTDEESKEDAQQSKKRKKTDSASAAAPTPVHTPVRSLSGHIGAVTALVYPHPSSLYSGSMDHNLKQWDVESGACTSTWFGRQVVTALDFSLASNVLGSGHHDKVIRIWDPRQSEKEVMKLQMRSHKGWVSGVKFHPSHAHQLASTSYDHSVKIWDMRASLPLFTLQAHTDKALTLDWMDESVDTRAL
jgi:ribosome biogenesis protein YTM1